MAKKTSEDIACGLYFDQFVRELEERGFPFYPAKNQRDSTRYRYFSADARLWVYGHSLYPEGASVFLCLYDEQANEMALNKLLPHRKTIEKTWGVGLSRWESRIIGISRSGASFSDEKSSAEIRAWAVKQMFKLAIAIPPFMLQQVAAELPPHKSAK